MTVFSSVKSFVPLLLLLLATVEVYSQHSQSYGFDQDSISYHTRGDKNLNIGIGLINATDFAFNLIGGGSGSGNPSPSLNLSYEYGLSRMISVGAFFNYYKVDAQNDFTLEDINVILDDPLCALACNSPIPIPGTENCLCDGGSITERNNVFTFGGKLSYHRYVLEGLDTYASTYLGYSFNRRNTITESALSAVLNEIDSEVTVPKIVYYASAGVRYFITPQIGLYGEFGYGNTHLLQIGATYRIGY